MRRTLLSVSDPSPLTLLFPGSYGAAPLPVVEALQRIQAQCDAAPDRFMRLDYESQLVALRARLAEYVDCDTDDLVMVANATSGVNEVLRGMTTEWKKGDRMLCFSTSMCFLSLSNLFPHSFSCLVVRSYPACVQTLQYIIDAHPHLSLSLLNIPVTYPTSHADLIAKTRAAIEEADNDGTGRKVRLALIDSISSNPGVIVPWEELVKLFREKDILSYAHPRRSLDSLADVHLTASLMEPTRLANCPSRSARLDPTFSSRTHTSG